MKNKLFLIASALLLSVAVNNQSVKVNADSQISETVYYADMIKHTAANQGQMYTGAQLVDYAIMHGNAKNDAVQAFTTYDTSLGTLGSTQENSYCIEEEADKWVAGTLNNDGIIAVMTAKENLTVSNSWTTAGWVDPARFGLYKKSNGTMMAIVDETEITTSNKATIFTIEDVFVAKGETLYYEFRFPWSGSHRTMQYLNHFNFTFVQDTTTVVEPNTKESTLAMGNMIIATGNASGGSTSTELANYTIKHGNVDTNNVHAFTTYGQTGDATMQLGSDAENAYAKNWAIYAKNNEGIIVEITANYNIKVNVSLPNETASGWTEDTKVDVYKKNDSTTQLVKSSAISIQNPNKSYFEASVNLSKGETMYYQFSSYADAHRNLQTLPVFNISYVNHNQHAVNQVESYMNLAYRYTAADNTSEFRLQVGVDASIVDIEAASWGIEVSTETKTMKFDEVVKEDGTIKYVVIGLGDVLNNTNRAKDVFTARAYIEVDGVTYYSEAVKSYNVAQMVAEYKTQGKPVDGMYQAFVDAGLYA